MYVHADSVFFDDTAGEVSYFPPDAWLHNDGTGFYNSTYHYTRIPWAYVTVTFNGSFIAYFSDLNHDHGDFSVSVDGSSAGTWSSYAPQLSLSAALLFSAFLDPGVHILRIDNAATSTILGVDLFITSLSVQSTSSALSIMSSSLHSTGSSAPSGTIANNPPLVSSPARHQGQGAGIPRVTFYATITVLFALLAVLAAAAAAFVVRRRHRERRRTLPVDSPFPIPAAQEPPPYNTTDAPLRDPSSPAKGPAQTPFIAPEAIFDTAISVSL